MTIIIQTSGFDLEDELQLFVENRLCVLLRERLKISEIKILLGNWNGKIGKRKFCHFHIIGKKTKYNILRYENLYEEDVLCSVKEIDLEINKT